jgi:pimeloyl-ACP methyl ester carboxylesterase
MNAMRRAFHCLPSCNLLKSAALICACLWLSVPAAVAQGVACEADARPQPMTLRTFRETVDGLAAMQSQPAAASAMLLCLQKSHAALAETLMLFQGRLRPPMRSEAEVERAFLHYVINSAKPQLAGNETANLERLARTYRESLLLAAEPEADALLSCGAPPWTLSGLRCVGQFANRDRYGRGDVVPVDLLEFDPSAEGYSTRDATWMAEMSALAYRGPEMVGKQLRRWDFSLVSEILDPATDTNGFIASRDKVLVVAFRGTSGFRDFVTDVDIRRVRPEWAAGGVHSGFENALDGVWSQLISRLGPPAAQHKDIWLTGHSLGAALAQLAALRLSRAGYRVHRVYTFGTPRIGDKDFVADYDRRLSEQSFPHVNWRDVVTRVPPAALGFRAAASAKTRKFTGSKHELKVQPDEASDALGVADDWRTAVTNSINKTTAFLPDELRPRALRSLVPISPTANLYAAEFSSGPLDDHGSFQYMFKLVCASIDYDLWPIEIRRSATRSPDLLRR